MTLGEWLKDGEIYYIYAEYNPYWIYMGWWLYAIPTSDLEKQKEKPYPKDMSKWDQATWLNYEWRLESLFRGIGLPEFDSFRNPPDSPFKPDPSNYCPVFFHKYPGGVVCETKHDGREFIKKDSENLGDYSRIVRERQLDHIAKAQEKVEKEREDEAKKAST